jgi:hypothetical protein
MKNKFPFLRIIPFIILFLSFLACDDSSNITNNDTIYGSGHIVSQTRTVQECSGLIIQNIGNVYFTQANEQSIRVEADDNIIDDVISRKEDGLLLVGLKDGSYSNITLKIYVSLKTISNLSINGAGNISVENDILCDTLKCTINGAGNILIKGSTNCFDCLVNGAGNITASDFISNKCKAIVNGAGTITVYVSEELDASIIGAGTIYYYGNPPIVSTSISGLGQIIKM